VITKALRTSIACMLAACSCSSLAMNYAIRSLKLGPNPAGDYLLMSGEITRGDVERLRAFVAANSQRVPSLLTVLDSPGGDLDEALRLAQAVRDLRFYVMVPPGFHCVSACFFIYVGAAQRDAWGMDTKGEPAQTLGVHRPRFDATETRGLTLEQAEKAHNAAFARAKQWLQGQFVPQALIDKLLSLPSSQVYWLSSQDIDAIGSRAPWFEEWLLARCPGFIEAERRVLHPPNGGPASQAAKDAFADQVKCAVSVLIVERRSATARFAGGSR
jgi:hypothetical protein